MDLIRKRLRQRKKEISDVVDKRTKQKKQIGIENVEKKKRQPFNPSFQTKNNISFAASLTVECAMVLPIFMFAMLSVIYLIEAVNFSSMMSAALCETATEYSGYAYAYSRGISGGGIVGKAVSLTAARATAPSCLGNGFMEKAPVVNGASGISFLRSSVLDRNEMIDLTADYRIGTPYNFLGFLSIPVTDAARVRAFTGYDNTGRGYEEGREKERIVYITETGTVYHSSLSCRHLKLNIMTSTVELVKNRRANDGSRYYPCSCAGGITSGVVYITDDGNRYHGTLSCHALKRTIKSIPISKAGGRSPCRDCN